MTREIVLDTETTGLNASKGDRIIEIACVELTNHLQTGPEGLWQRYINPQRDVPEEAVLIHGIKNDFLLDKPIFSDVVEEFMDFIGTDPIIIHNASFDIGFLNMEMSRLNRPPIDQDREIIDTVTIARQKFPGAQASLDALCRRFGIDNTGRTLHGALLDAQLLAEVYLELLGGRQHGLQLLAAKVARANGVQVPGRERPVRPARPHMISEAEMQRHRILVGCLKDPVWLLE